MKVLHTADWHIGQTFHGYDRSAEHQQFLNWLLKTLQKREIDALLISGDVFDLSNPGASSVKMFYHFLGEAQKIMPYLQILIVAGNHDSPSRLEAPIPLLDGSGVHITGMIEKNDKGEVRYDKLMVPLKNREGETEAWCITMPFIRLGDAPPVVNGSGNSYVDGIVTLYREAYNKLEPRLTKNQAIITMGHLHALSAEVTELDNTERKIMGGIEYVPSSAFGNADYVALGHIHKTQKIGEKGNIYYSGSPLPLSFSETEYQHSVITFNIKQGKVENIKQIPIPVSVPLLRIPAEHASLNKVLAALEELPNASGNKELAPFIEVRVLLWSPEPSMRFKIETAIANKQVRLAKIDVRYPNARKEESTSTGFQSETIEELTPAMVFSGMYEEKFKVAVPKKLMELFNTVVQEVEHMEEHEK